MKDIPATFLLFVFLVKSVFAVENNLLTNGSFEIEGDSSTNIYDLRTNSQLINGWQYDPLQEYRIGNSGVNGFITEDNSVYPNQFTTPYGNRWVYFGGGSPNAGGTMTQNIELAALTGGQRYRASIWAKGYGANTEPVTLNLIVGESQNKSASRVS